MGRVVSVLPGLSDLQLCNVDPISVFELVRFVERVVHRKNKLRVEVMKSTSVMNSPRFFWTAVYYLRKAIEKEHFFPVVPEEHHNEALRWWFGNCLKLNLLN